MHSIVVVEKIIKKDDGDFMQSCSMLRLRFKGYVVNRTWHLIKGETLLLLKSYGTLLCNHASLLFFLLGTIEVGR